MKWEDSPHALALVTCPKCGNDVVMGRIDFNGYECPVYIDEYDAVYGQCQQCNTQVRTDIEVVKPREDFQ